MSNETNELIKRLTNAFLNWPLPKSVCADLCATKQQEGRIGTNLLTYTEAKAMFEAIVLPVITRPFHSYEEWKEFSRMEDELDNVATLCRRLCKSLGTEHPLSKRAMEYLKEHDLTGSPLRDGKQQSAFEAEAALQHPTPRSVATEELLGVAEGVLTALKYPRGSEAQVRCLEEVGQDAEYFFAKQKTRPKPTPALADVAPVDWATAAVDRLNEAFALELTGEGINVATRIILKHAPGDGRTAELLRLLTEVWKNTNLRHHPELTGLCEHVEAEIRAARHTPMRPSPGAAGKGEKE